MSIADEFKSRNFSIYGQWLGILCIVLGFALGIANLFSYPLLIIWSVILIVSAFTLIFIEIPLLLRICPTSAKFDGLIRKVTTNYIRAGVYAVMSIIQWTSLALYRTSLIAAAVVLLLTSLCYLAAAVKGQEFQGSKTLGGQGVAQMIV